MPVSGLNFSDVRLKVPPQNDEIEMTVFGKGYGECIILSCGNNEFIVVDSFINQETKNPVAIDYLNALEIPLSAIKEIVITHWHKDHIDGIYDLIKAVGGSAKIVLSPIINQKKFAEYIAYGQELGDDSTSEFVKIYEYISSNKGRNVIYAKQNVSIYVNENLGNVSLNALSPQDNELFSYLNSLVLPDENQKVAYSFLDDNMLSIVLLLKHNYDGILLGSDMENKTYRGGWEAIVNNYCYTKTHPTVFKIPHHGSSNGHNEKVWKQILCEKPTSVLTRFNRSNKLPKKSDITRISSLSKELYIVGQAEKKDKLLANKLRKFPLKMTPVSTQIGMFRYRTKVDSSTEKIETFGAVEKET